MVKSDGVMAEFIVRELREGNKSKLQVVINGDQVAAEGALHPIGLNGHPLYADLYAIVLRLVKVS